jgi:hypothetical protein
VTRTLHHDLADDASAAPDRDYRAKKTAVSVIDLLAPELAWIHVRDQHVTHARTPPVNAASTIGYTAVRSKSVDPLLIPRRLPSRSMPLDVWMLALVVVLTIVSLLYVRGLEKLP